MTNENELTPDKKEQVLATKKKILELKAQAYDLLAAMEFYQKQLVQINQNISESDQSLKQLLQE